MDRSGGLQEDTILYRGGEFPFNMIPGMKGKFPCFSSTSYRKETAEAFQDGGEYLIKIYAPKGTRGLCGGGKLGGNFPIGDESEHEFTLGKGQEYIVLNRDDWNKTVEIILI